MSDDAMGRHDARTFLARREGRPPLDDEFAGDAGGAERYLTAAGEPDWGEFRGDAAPMVSEAPIPDGGALT